MREVSSLGPKQDANSVIYKISTTPDKGVLVLRTDFKGGQREKKFQGGKIPFFAEKYNFFSQKLTFFFEKNQSIRGAAGPLCPTLGTPLTPENHVEIALIESRHWNT